MLKAGQLDVLMGATMTDERQAYAHFSSYYRDEELRLFVLDEQKDQINVDKWEDIFTKSYACLCLQAVGMAPIIKSLNID
ncbi:hypothetical protein LFREDSHE_35480 [Shewanella baltica]